MPLPPRCSRAVAAALLLLTTTASTLLATGSLEPASAGGSWAVPAPRPNVDPMTHLGEYANRVMASINHHRAKAGLPKVRFYSACVDGYAEAWALHLAALGTLVHRDQRFLLRACDLTWVGEALVRAENVSPAQVVSAWMHSPEHRAVIMKRRANRAGIGITLDGQGRLVGVLNFADVN
ncbi:CAP domain-containing protein [Oryzihumus sp.]